MVKSSISLHRITISAVFLSLSLVLQTTFSLDIPLFGQNGMRIGISGIFTVMPSLLFGPAYGFVVSGLSDFLGYLLRPSGTYLPLMTLIVAFGGFFRGILWNILQHRNSHKLRIAVAIFSILLLFIGICNLLFLRDNEINAGFYDHVQTGNINTDHMHLISKMLIERALHSKDPSGNLAAYIIIVTAGIISCSTLGIFLLIVDFFLSKKLLHQKENGLVPKLLIAMIGSGLMVTTFNTILLRETLFTAWKAFPFAFIWIPRAIEEILGNTVEAYFVAILLNLLKKRQDALQMPM